MAGTGPDHCYSRPPDEAKAAVFVSSDPIPEGLQSVQGIDFNLHENGDISVVDLVEGMSSMGFQASAIGDAVRIINGMVCPHLFFASRSDQGNSDCPCRERGGMMRLTSGPPFFLATLPI